VAPPTDDATDADPSDAPDPAISYPRGNRLGLRHPRPTVVIVVAVLVVLAGAFAWRALQPPDARSCDLAGLGGAPTANTEEAAIQAWIDQTQDPGSTTESRYGTFPGPTSVDQFTREDDGWIYRVGDAGMKVEVGPGYRVTAANLCGWQPLR
jgi:hypothetical protein